MDKTELKVKMLVATKWATITEVIAKFIVPITNMILARILKAESFGVLATVMMVFSFADMFTDAGFQKYLLQHEFKNEEDKDKGATVAFWTNLGISTILWGVIAVFNKQISSLYGDPSLGIVIIISCSQLLTTSFSCIQMALYKRRFDFKTLFLVRIITVCIPFVITIPLALFGLSYWALIIGMMCGQIANAVILTVKSDWKPKLFYDVSILKEMVSFSIWSLVEAISIWFTTWADSLIIGSVFSSYYLGLYKTSTNMVNSIMVVITSSTTSVLFTTLSRLQNDNDGFNNMFLKTQEIVSILIFPLGVGIFLYRDLATKIFLGSQWNESSNIIGIWALAQAITIVFGYYCSEVYRAKGRPKISFLVQLLYIVVLIPTCLISSQYGFWTFVYMRSLVVLEFVIVHLLVMKFVIGIPISRIIKNVFPAGISAIIMGCMGYFLLKVNEGLLWNALSIMICIFFYFLVLSVFPGMKKVLKSIILRLMKQNS